jgi:hypothetical protein
MTGLFDKSMISKVLSAMFSNVIPFKAYWANKLFGEKGKAKRHLIARGKIIGTTPSGHPNKTTLGNTLRIILFWHFIAFKANLVWKKDIACL